MWGPPSSGKTTFLLALDTALNRKKYGYTLAADDDASEAVMIKATAGLSGRLRFPEGTQKIDYFQWTLYGTRQEKVTNGRSVQLVDVPHRITLKLADPSGELALLEKLTDPDRKRLIANLAESNAIIFMFDPIREFEKGDAFETTNGLLHQLKRQLASTDPNFNGKLPHHVAVCVTKFDEPRILDTAARLKALEFDQDDPHRFPRVDEYNARRLLTALCSVSGSGNGDLMLNSLDQHFHESRIKFFVTSAVGFHVNPDTNMFDINDPQNLVKDRAGLTNETQSRIRGPLHPINIVEPVLWLGEQVSGT
jgi:hypothetical protein